MLGASLGRAREFWFGRADLAPLGLFRVLFGLLVINWFWQLWPDARALFTDDGIAPRTVPLARLFGDRFTLLNLSGELWLVDALLVAGLVAGLALAVGYRTRTAAVVVFILLISFEQRDPLMLDGSDVVMRTVAFWLIWCDAGGRYAIDAALRRARGERVDGTGWAFPVRLLWLQIAWVYLATGLEKLGGTTWLDGTALYWTLQLQNTFARAHAEPLTHVLPFVRAGTWATVTAELAFVPLVFAPLAQPGLRLAALAAAATVQFGILALMNVGNFPFLMFAALVPFLPAGAVAAAVERVSRWISRGGRLRVLYDGHCALCVRTARFLAALDIAHRLDLADFRAATTDRAGLPAARLEHRLHVVDEQGRPFAGFAAFARIGRAVPALLPLAALGSLPGMGPVGGWTYDRLADRRILKVDCRGDACTHALAEPRVPARSVSRWKRIVGGAALSATAVVALGGALPVPASRARQLPLSGAALYLSLDQRWDLFAPDPTMHDRWFRVVARLADGSVADLLDRRTSRPVPGAPARIDGDVDGNPREPDPLYNRWLRINERAAYGPELAPEYARMFCRLGPAGPSAVATLQFWLFDRLVPAPGGAPTPAVRYLIWTQPCF